jgi:hypothetical protein
MYDEAKKRKIKMNEKIDRINKYNNEIEDASKYTKKIKSECGKKRKSRCRRYR